MALIELPYIVLDQNVLRDEVQIRSALELATKYQTSLLLPDVALMEMMKNEQWESTARRSLALLAKTPSRIAIAWGTGELLRNELAAGHPQIDLVDNEVTEQFRAVLEQLRTKPQSALDELRPHIPGAQSMAQRQHLNHQHNKNRILRMVDAWKGILKPEAIKALRRENSDDLFQALLASENLTNLFEDWLKGADFPPDAARRLAAERSITSHVCLCYAALGLRWLKRQGIEGVQSEKVTNDLVDMDYVLIASFCIKLFTKEGNVNRMLEDIKAVAELRNERFLIAE
ncbi:hypothetical protein [Corallococcus sp. AB030]|uniref:hypothetical protein n=1 Tax=Corallococcus sp. AB030 TaxID=2316716 RepID=UPI0011E5F336|nr:hypothetical protein [Corallococcus sp. AB030]